MILKIIFTSLIGTLLHFTYDFSKKNKFVGIISAVNESTWEHIKMALTPILLFFIIDLIIFDYKPSLIISYFGNLLTVIILIPLIFYSYTYFSKKPILLIDICSFYVSIIIGYIVGYKLFNLVVSNNIMLIISFCGLFLIFGAYLIFTKYPPKCFLFLDKTTNTYGIGK